MNNSSIFAELSTEAWITPVLIVYGLIFLTSIIMNSLVVGTFCRYECLHSIHDRLIFALSSVNMILLIGMPFYLMYSIGYSFVLKSQYFCLLNYVILHGGIGCSVFLQLGLALDRYMCIVWPWKHSKIRKRYVILYVLISYIFGFGVNLLPAWGWNSWSEYNKCVWQSFPWEYQYFVRITMMAILVINLGIHLYVLHVANRHSRKIRRLIKRIRREHSRTGGCEHTAVTTVVLLAVISSLCWFPYWIAALILPQDTLTTIFILQILYAIIILNSVTSPLLFVMRNRHFRDAMCKLLTLNPKLHHCGT
ncbi:adenosine receptor A2b-like [Saccostrea echinata]|uniref:adenosine receptor A2b-like n=1 Tax=Saccostrea echinata TaxID=191078 RepID=UPI002A8239FA|nr:adenosine receptor A2b-like [Saccostrea echinata]